MSPDPAPCGKFECDILVQALAPSKAPGLKTAHRAPVTAMPTNPCWNRQSDSRGGLGLGSSFVSRHRLTAGTPSGPVSRSSRIRVPAPRHASLQPGAQSRGRRRKLRLQRSIPRQVHPRHWVQRPLHRLVSPRSRLRPNRCLVTPPLHPHHMHRDATPRRHLTHQVPVAPHKTKPSPPASRATRHQVPQFR